MPNDAEEIGNLIAGALNQGTDIIEEGFPNEALNSLLTTPFDRLQITQTVRGIARHYGTTCFILDHPVYGELDSSVLRLDCGYVTTDSGAPFPLDFSKNGGLGFAFNEVDIKSSTLLFTYSS